MSAQQSFTSTTEQRAIIEDAINANQLIVAGAGSGKTMTMTMRVVKLIEAGVAPERILGLTFTRKAASELLTRVSAAVMEEHSSGSSMFLKPEVLTYDAFFQSIVRQYGLLVGFNQATQPLSEAGAYQLAAEVVGEHVESLFATDNQSQNPAHGYDPSDSWRGDEAPDFSDERMLRRLAAATPSTDDVASQSFTTTVNNVLAIARSCSNAMIDGSCTSFEQAARKIHLWDAAFITHMDDILEGLEIPSTDPSPSKVAPLDLDKKLSEKTRAKRIANLEHYRTMRRIFRANHVRTVAQNREILLSLAEQYQQAKRRANMAEFSDFTVAAYQLVTRFPSIGAHYRRRFSHVFLDEYQDTSTTQALLIAALFNPSEHSSQVSSSVTTCAADASAVSAVGDPFQSIYAWRGASPGAFRTFLRQFDAGSSHMGNHVTHQYALSQTFRNGSLVLNAANNLTLPLRQSRGKTSSALMREVDVTHLRAREGADKGTVALLATQCLDEEIQGVVSFVKEAKRRYTTNPSTHHSPAQQRDESHRDDAISIDTTAPHVAILFRSKTNLPQFCQALHDAAISYEVVGYSALLERPEIRDLRAALNIVCNHTGTDSMMRLLATPRFNVNPADLRAFAQMTNTLNMQSQYRGLVEAQLAPAHAKPRAMAAYVKQHRDAMPNTVFAIDVLMADNLDATLRQHAPHMSERGKYLLGQASRVLRQIQSQLTAGLKTVIRTAIQALQLDIDVVLSQAWNTNNMRLDRGSAQTSLDTFATLIDTFEAELQDGTPSTLRGFVAWVDSMGKSPDEAAANINGHPDVVLMTIHQAKGLEWDAVAVVGMKSGTFPSNKGDGLKITETKAAVIDKFGTVLRPAEYASSAKSWMDDPTAVPVPMRADASILPRFPHDAEPDSDPLANIETMKLSSLEDEIYGECRDDDSDDWLAQQREYGSRFHADERRLAYVALTRARHDVLLSYSANKNANPRRKQDDLLAGNAASNFWKESYESLKHDPTAITLESEDMAEYAGLFVGEHAQGYGTALREALAKDASTTSPQLVNELESGHDEQADQTTPDLSGASTASMLWPMKLNPTVATALEGSAQLVHAKNLDMNPQQHTSAAPDSLLAQATRIVDQRSGRLGALHGNGEDLHALRASGLQVLSTSGHNVTAVQALAGQHDEQVERRYWRGIVRPIPRMPSAAAQAGTQFHQWASVFLSAQDDFTLQQDDGADGLLVPATRQSMLAALADEETHGQETQGSSLLDWEQRLSTSPWAHRSVAWVERPIVASIDGRILKGKLDAVFHGPLHYQPRTDSVASASEDEYTIVDWKTGRRPISDEDIRIKLLQLDLYRLLLSMMLSIDISRIDACLYYVSEPRAQLRQIPALTRSSDEIIQDLDAGLPVISDED